MEHIFFSGSFIFLFIGMLGGILYPVLGNAGIYMIVPLLMLLTGLPADMAVPIGLAHFAALIIPAAVGHWQTGNLDYKLLLLIMIGFIPGLFLAERIQLNLYVFIPYLILLVGAIIYKIRPFALLPKPNNHFRKITLRVINQLPGKTFLTFSGIKVSFIVPIIVGGLLSFTGKLFGPIAALLLCPILIICLDIPVMVAVATSTVCNFIGMLSFAMWNDFLMIPLNLKILLWLFLGSSITVLVLSSVIKKKLYPVPVAALLVLITSFTLWTLMLGQPGHQVLIQQFSFPSNLLGWFGGVQG
ncbi:protein of unknown function DUF81 [Desulforamulus reducens MI-1]|uniref:Probable membrane transporter protein n=1 Tax=Desulforamulus reducens (strain ATCC BAA-1160 / DSM 100696 / MI-1) TaxID=349161 RepID=A4J444_DESRM|nr:sulfite exporter TauE/SafE family protein [Desulforamulus reducens]ABO49847.1 protein of unknown function DUF81 [Desulforamulus reducens MI-1]